MNFKKYSLLLVLFVFIASCSDKPTSKKITNQSDYEPYLTNETTKNLNESTENLFFWEKKLNEAPNQYPYLYKIASSNTKLFSATGKIKHLKTAEEHLLNLLKKSPKASAYRSLARNYISQHRFQESLEFLKKAKKDGEKLEATQKMLFDVYLELGNYDEAENYLKLFQNPDDFDYLIRASKWNDVLGNLELAITFLEKALNIAKSSNNKDLIMWSYTNLADFYGHNNQIEKSYNYYLKSLELDPQNAYAKKGIAWIVYSHEKNPKEALRIIDKIQENYHSPDYYLFKAELAEYMNDEDLKNENIYKYLSSVSNPLYGEMYNQYNIKLYLDEFGKRDEALKIIQREIENRPTPESYDLLAWAHYKEGNYKKSLEVANIHVVGKSQEPEVLYHLAEIYKANSMNDKALNLKKELIESSYELGPMMIQKIQNI